jgi:ABC-type uncharacterized transport system substrate-binding protein
LTDIGTAAVYAIVYLLVFLIGMNSSGSSRVQRYQEAGLFRRLFCVLLILASLAGACAVPGAAQDGEMKEVLVLHSYHEGHEWTDSITDGIETVLDTKDQDVKLYIEYLDASRIVEDGYAQKIYELYRLKYGDSRFDAVIVSDDEAFSFISERHKDLFPGTPCIFTGVNYYDPSLIPAGVPCTGVVESIDIRGTLDVALDLHPGTRQVVVINDQTVTGIANRKLLDEITPAYEDRVSFVYLEDMKMSSLRGAVGDLPEDSIILFLTFNRDAAGTHFEYDESVAVITETAEVPVYSVWDFYLGKGIMGGSLTEGFHQGRIAGELTLRVLNGEDVADILVVRQDVSRYMFDRVQLDRFGIADDKLPDGSTIINEQAGIVVDSTVFWGTIFGIVVLVVAVIILGLNIYRRRLAEEELRKNEEKFRMLAQKQHEALEQIEKNLEDMAILNDHIRNPLTVIVALADMDGGTIRESVLSQAREIDLLINKLDKGWLESQKIQEFLRRHYPGKD